METDPTELSPGAPPPAASQGSAPGDPALDSPSQASARLPEARLPELGPRAEPDSANPQMDALLRELGEALAESDSRQLGQLIDGKYLTEAFIGKGGMSRVFEATNCLTGRRVALKWLHDGAGLGDASDPRRLLQEARAIARIEHPNVIQVLDVGFVDGRPYLVLERLRGQALNAYLKEHGTLAPAVAAAWLGPVLGAAHVFHLAGVVHRDLKPANLFVVHDGVTPPYLKVLDFGVALLAPEGAASLAESQPLTAPGAVVGTPLYMAPEQLRHRAVDARTDVFALGTILYEMITGERPFPARDLADLVMMMVSEDSEQRARRFTRVAPSLGTVLARALAHEPADRFQTALDFQQALSALELSSVVGSPQAPPTPLLVGVAPPASVPVAAIAVPTGLASPVPLPRSPIAASTSPRRWVGALLAILLVTLLVVVARSQRGATPSAAAPVPLDTAQPSLTPQAAPPASGPAPGEPAALGAAARTQFPFAPMPRREAAATPGAPHGPRTEPRRARAPKGTEPPHQLRPEDF